MKTYIVIGAGILGASTSYHLAKEGEEVYLVDRYDQGQATDAAAGIVCPWLSQRRNKSWYKLAKSGAKYYPILMKQLEMDGELDTGYKKVGAITLHQDENKLIKMIERARKRRREAPEIGEITRLSPNETRSLFPLLSEQYGSVHISGAARVNGRALRLALINAAKKHKAKFIKGDAALVYKNQRITGITVNDETISADQVIITAGAWANELLLPLGIRFLVTFQKGQIIHLHIPEIDTNRWPVIMPPNDQIIVPFDNGRIVIGSTHENNVGFDYRITAGGMHEILEKALSVAPGLASGAVVETRVGFRPFTPGFLPVIGQMPNYEGLLLANGLGASGITVGPYLGYELATLARGKRNEINLEDYHIAQAIESI